MDIIEEMEEKRQEFDKIESKIEEYQKSINELIDELKRLQGEYRLLVKMGYNQGILDEKGNPLEKEIE